MEDKIITEELKRLHSEFVAVPIDKAGSNNAFAYRRHYAQVLTNELGLNYGKKITATYIKVIKSLHKIVSDNA